MFAIASPQVIRKDRLFSLVDANATAFAPTLNSNASSPFASAVQQALFGNPSVDAPVSAALQQPHHLPASSQVQFTARPINGRRLHAAANPANADALTDDGLHAHEASPHLGSALGTDVKDAAVPDEHAYFANADDLDTSVDEANIAFFIQISDATVAHLPRLLNRIYHANHTFLIHFDKKVDPMLTQRVQNNLFKRNAAYRDNVHFMRPELITYRGISMLLNTINAMRHLLKVDSKWHYFINISGADYPLVSQRTMRSMLGKHIKNPLNFVTFAPKSKWKENLGFRVDHIYVDEALSFQTEGGTVQQLPALNPIARKMKLTYVNAEAWMINSREFCKFVVTSGFARKLLVAFAYSVESSEHYFATLLWNHDYFNRTTVAHSMRHVVWDFEGRRAGQHPFYVDERDGNNNFVLRKAVESAPTFFIRKFKSADSPLMDVVDERWANEGHLRNVREKMEWHVGQSLREHAVKPRLISKSPRWISSSWSSSSQILS